MSDRYSELIDIGESRTLDENMDYTRQNIVGTGGTLRNDLVCLWGRDLSDCNELPLKGEYLCAGHLLVWRANGGKDKGD